MSAPTLKRYLGEGGAGLDESNGASSLRDVLAALAKDSGPRIGGNTASPGTGALYTYNVLRDGVLQSFRARAATAGSSGVTTLELRLNGSPVASISIDNADPDGTSKEGLTTTPIQVKQGDVVVVQCTAAATGLANLYVDAVIQPAAVE